MRWLLVLLALAGCAIRPPRTIEQARQQYERHKARSNPSQTIYYPKR